MSYQVTEARLRIAQRALIAAVSSNPELTTDENWQQALRYVTELVTTTHPPIEDKNQLSLFSVPSRFGEPLMRCN